MIEKKLQLHIGGQSMKKFIILVVLIYVSFFMFSCSKSTDTDTTAPTVNITFPANNQQFTQGAVITITVTATDAGGIKEVKFYIDGTQIGTDDTTPYEYEWDTGAIKDTTHSIYAKAWDNNDNVGTSSTINITLTNTVTDYDGNVYHIVKIGDQEWLLENLKVTHFRNGDAIPQETDNATWADLTTAAYCMYDNSTTYGQAYGYLYNWYAVSDTRGLAPEGWHIPSDEEWKELEMALGMSQAEADAVGWRGTDQGGQLKEAGTTHWANPNTAATNTSGFTALGGGRRSGSTGYFTSIGNYAFFWTSTEYDADNTWTRWLAHDTSQIDRTGYPLKGGYTVRCVRD